jgi:hypothetical protein
MSDKELIKQEIERRIKEGKDSYAGNLKSLLHFIESLDNEDRSVKLDYFHHETKTFKSQEKHFIYSLPEESGCEIDFTTKEDWEEAMERSVSEESILEFFATGQPTIGAYGEDSLRNQFEAGIEWHENQMKGLLQTEYEKGRFDMKEEMMKDAVGGVVHHFADDEVAAVHYNDPKGTPMSIYVSSKELSAGDRVKIIIIKEELNYEYLA